MRVSVCRLYDFSRIFNPEITHHDANMTQDVLENAYILSVVERNFSKRRML